MTDRLDSPGDRYALGVLTDCDRLGHPICDDDDTCLCGDRSDVLEPTTYRHRTTAIGATVTVEARPPDQWGARYACECELAGRLVAARRFATAEDAIECGGRWAEAAEAFALALEAHGEAGPAK